MTAPDKPTPGELADRVESFAADIDALPADERRISVLRDDSAILRAAAAALRSLAAERDALMAVAGDIIDQDIDGYVTRIESQVASLRRKVARYIGKARGWRLAYRLLDSLLSFGEKK